MGWDKTLGGAAMARQHLYKQHRQQEAGVKKGIYHFFATGLGASMWFWVSSSICRGIGYVLNANALV